MLDEPSAVNSPGSIPPNMRQWRIILIGQIYAKCAKLFFYTLIVVVKFTKLVQVLEVVVRALNTEEPKSLSKLFLN